MVAHRLTGPGPVRMDPVAPFVLGGKTGGVGGAQHGVQTATIRIDHHQTDAGTEQVCRYLVKDFGTSQSPKSTRQRDSRYCPDRPALITTPSRTLQQSCSCATPS
ncbi:MAG: hypothetical protein G8D28_05185 [gamma proteobacterium symbiont of Phacoides pectinatus]